MADAPLRGTAVVPAPRATGEMRWVLLVAVAVVLLASVPHVMGFLANDGESTYGHALIYEGDFNSYAAYAQQAAEGRWLFRDPYTPEPHAPVLFNLEFLVLGRLAAGLGLTTGGAIQLERIVAGLLLVLAMHRLSRFVLPDPSRRLAWLVAALLGGEFGWLVYTPGLADFARRLSPVDRYAGLHPFFWLMLLPRFVLSETLTVLALCAYIAGETGRPRAHALAALASLAVAASRPYDGLLLAVVGSAYCLLAAVRDRRVAVGPSLLRLSIAWGAVPPLAYSTWVFDHHPVFQWWQRQGATPPPPPVGFALGLGLVLLPFVVACRRWWREGHLDVPRTVLLLTVGCGVGLLYSYPRLNFSLQFITTVLVPLSLLAATALPEAGWRRRLPALLVLLAANSLTSAVLLKRAIREVREGAHRTPNTLLGAFAWLQAHSSTDDVVLAGPETSNLLPRYTRDIVVCGYLSTVDLAGKTREVARFFAAEADGAERAELLERYRVRYVIHGPEEQAMGGWTPGGESQLQRVFADGPVAVYAVSSRGRSAP